MKTWVWAILGLLVLSFIVIGFSSSKTNTSLGGVTTLDKYPVTQKDHILGDLNTAKVVVVEYGDFQCPACAAYAPLLKQSYEAYKGQVAIVFRHFPLVEIHTRAIDSAKAAEAAGAQGKFFEMLDMLYSNQDAWVQSKNPQELFMTYAKTIGLNTDKFSADMKAQNTESIIKTGREEAQALKLTGTPSLFVNGKLIPLPLNGQEFQKIIDSEINGKQSN